MSKQRKPQSPPPNIKNEKAEPQPVFELRYTEDAAVEIKGLDGSVRQHLRKVLDKKLAVNPEGYGLPLRDPLTNYWKHEFGDHRVVYRIYPDLGIVAVCAVGPRKQGDREDIYNRLEAVAKSGRLAEQIASVLRNVLPKEK
jgi:mRNA-degrading endonuclease RelE of RelBE toxin-antitoxin system